MPISQFHDLPMPLPLFTLLTVFLLGGAVLLQVRALRYIYRRWSTRPTLLEGGVPDTRTTAGNAGVGAGGADINAPVAAVGLVETIVGGSHCQI
jgi:hypothetical protein